MGIAVIILFYRLRQCFSYTVSKHSYGSHEIFQDIILNLPLSKSAAFTESPRSAGITFYLCWCNCDEMNIENRF